MTGLAGPDLDRLAAIAGRALDAAGAAIRPHFRVGIAAETKFDESPVTLADRAAETAMRAVLAEATPGFGILGEEAGLERGDARHRWVLDPIDGTRAFLTGRPAFGCLIALMDDDEPLIGAIDQPITGERWVGVEGRPTRFAGPFGGTAGTRGCSDLSQAELSATSPDMFAPSDRAAFDRLGSWVRRRSWGGDCYAYGLLALGQIDAIAEADLKVWDWAALAPVVRGAGGSLTDWQGRPPRVGGDGRVLALGDPSLLGPAVALLSQP